MAADNLLLDVKNLKKYFPVRKGIFRRIVGHVKAVDDIDLYIKEGETLGLVGESGCGKTTTGRTIMRLIEPSGGRIRFRGKKLAESDPTSPEVDVVTASPKMMKFLRRDMQIIFQDPYSSLDPRMKVADIVTEPMRATRQFSQNQRRNVAAEMLRKVGLRSLDLDKYPHEFSGGQRQRIGIARSLCVRPELIVADEPVSALDVSIQAQVINLMEDLKAEFNLSYIFISHDLSVVEYVCDRIAVMYLGVIVELAPTRQFSVSPRHPYTEALLKAVPLPDPHRRTEPFSMEGDVPNPIDPPPGCPFHPRCLYRFDRCSGEKPLLIEASPGHLVACWLNDGRGLCN